MITYSGANKHIYIYIYIYIFPAGGNILINKNTLFNKSTMQLPLLVNDDAFEKNIFLNNLRKHFVYICLINSVQFYFCLLLNCYILPYPTLPYPTHNDSIFLNQNFLIGVIVCTMYTLAILISIIITYSFMHINGTNLKKCSMIGCYLCLFHILNLILINCITMRMYSITNSTLFYFYMFYLFTNMWMILILSYMYIYLELLVDLPVGAQPLPGAIIII
jgi:hypothetical protein